MNSFCRGMTSTHFFFQNEESLWREIPTERLWVFPYFNEGKCLEESCHQSPHSDSPCPSFFPLSSPQYARTAKFLHLEQPRPSCASLNSLWQSVPPRVDYSTLGRGAHNRRAKKYLVRHAASSRNEEEVTHGCVDFDHFWREL